MLAADIEGRGLPTQRCARKSFIWPGPLRLARSFTPCIMRMIEEGNAGWSRVGKGGSAPPLLFPLYPTLAYDLLRFVTLNGSVRTESQNIFGLQALDPATGAGAIGGVIIASFGEKSRSE